jgi:hypothetical protein
MEQVIDFSQLEAMGSPIPNLISALRDLLAMGFSQVAVAWAVQQTSTLEEAMELLLATPDVEVVATSALDHDSYYAAADVFTASFQEIATAGSPEPNPKFDALDADIDLIDADIDLIDADIAEHIATMEDSRSSESDLGTHIPPSGSRDECGICLERKGEAMFSPLCQMHISNRYCYECISRHIATELLEKARQPRCPQHNDTCEMSGKRCNYILTQVEVEQALPRSSTCPEDQNMVEKVMNAYFTLTAPKHLIKCPECKMHIELGDGERPGDNKLCTCLCGVTFCAVCNRSPYHFNTSCDEVLLLSQKYNEWQIHGREQRLKCRAENEAAYAKALRQHEADRTALQQEASAARKRLKEYQKDEMWKAKNCRCCPHCHKPVSKIEGCDAMRCGYDADTKDNHQPGCGKSFDWAKAEPYKPQMTPSQVPAVPRTIKSKPAQLEVLHHWMIEEGEALRCDECQTAIVGFRFECINCPSFSSCEICSAKIDIGSCKNHPSQGHIFKIFEAPQQAWQQHAGPHRPSADGQLPTKRRRLMGKQPSPRDGPQTEEQPVIAANQNEQGFFSAFARVFRGLFA